MVNLSDLVLDQCSVIFQDSSLVIPTFLVLLEHLLPSLASAMYSHLSPARLLLAFLEVTKYNRKGELRKPQKNNARRECHRGLDPVRKSPSSTAGGFGEVVAALSRRDRYRRCVPM